VRSLDLKERLKLGYLERFVNSLPGEVKILVPWRCGGYLFFRDRLKLVYSESS